MGTVIVLGAVVTVLGLTAAHVDRRALVIRAVLDALVAARLTAKDAQFYMGLDAPAWSRAMNVDGDLQLSIFKLAAMPLGFQTEFLARYAFLVVRQSALDIAEDIVPNRKSA
jgi:hypothetical protein